MTINVDDGFQHANTSVGGAGSTTGLPTTPAVGTTNGWTDINGSCAQINSNLAKLNVPNGVTDKIIRFENQADQHIQIFTDLIPSGGWIGANLRFPNSGGADNCYWIFATDSSMQIFQRPSGGSIAGTSPGTITGGTHYYMLDVSAVGSVITATLYDQGTSAPAQTGAVDAPGSLVATCTATDATWAGSTNGRFGMGSGNDSPSGPAMSYRRFVSYGSTPPPVVIAPDDVAIVYSPFNWDVTNTRALTINPGAYARLLIYNTISCTLAFDTSTMEGSFIIRTTVDDFPAIYTTVTNGSTTIDLTGGTPLALTQHIIEIMMVKATPVSNVRWDSTKSGFLINSISIDNAGTYKAPQKSPTNVIIYGDSITEGQATDGFLAQDAAFSFAYWLEKWLGVNVGVIGFGGQGASVGIGDVPTWDDSSGADSGSWFSICSGIGRSFTSPAPDIILIAQGQNDGGSINTTDSIATVTRMLALCPNAKIAWLVPLSGSSLAQIENTIVPGVSNPKFQYIDCSNFLTIPPDSDGHPFHSAAAYIYSPKLAAAVRALGWMGLATTSSTFAG